MTGNPLLGNVVPIEPLRDRQTAARLVADSLRTAIQSGRLVDGAELNQVALAEHFGTSRVPVREALRALEAEGWITAQPHRRAVVQSLSLERVNEIFDVRALLEAHLVRKTAGAIAPADLAALRALCDTMDAMRDHHEWVAANHRFHHDLLAAAASPMTLELIEQLASQVERYLRQFGADVIRESEAGDEHRAIVAAVAAHDAERAAELITAHIDRTRGRVIDALDRNRPPATSENR
jgi:DNA-binding GntR family transcriptional regulator